MRVAPKARPGDLIADKYRIQGVLGEGGMGVVFAARHEITGKPVALKWLTNPAPTARQRLLREAQAAGRIDHPNVVDVYDVGEHEGDMFLVMEWLRGMPLESAIAAGPMSAEDTIRIIMPVLRGVAAAHRLGVVHRDLKPDNIFLCESIDGSAMTVKVLDFGISKVTSQEEMKLTGQGQVIGTPLYMAPEQLLGKDVTTATDVYAIGCILFEMLEGVPAFDAQNFEELTARKITGHPQEFTRSPRGLRDIVARAIVAKPAERFQTVRELGEALEPFSNGVLKFADTDTDWSGIHSGLVRLMHRHTSEIPDVSEEAITGVSPTQPMRQWRTIMMIVAALAGVGAAVAVLALRQPPEPEVTNIIESEVGSPPPALDAGAQPANELPSESDEPGEEAEQAAEPEDPAPMRTRRTNRRNRPRMTEQSTMFRSGQLSIDEF